jgi:hypothetical protein
MGRAPVSRKIRKVRTDPEIKGIVGLKESNRHTREKPNMTKNILATLILLTAPAAFADDICDGGFDDDYVSTYDHAIEVSFDTPEGYTATGDLYCWVGNIDLAIAFEESAEEDLESVLHLVSKEVAEECHFLVEFDGDTETLNCYQDHILPGGEQVVVQRTQVLY